MRYLVHITSMRNLKQIQRQGLRGISYWAMEGEVSEYYKETVEDDGDVPLIVRMPLAVLEKYGIEPDFPGLEEPLTHTLGMKDEQVWEEWERCGQTWQDCLELIQSVRVREDIPESVLFEHNPHMRPVHTGVRFKP